MPKASQKYYSARRLIDLIDRFDGSPEALDGVRLELEINPQAYAYGYLSPAWGLDRLRHGWVAKLRVYIRTMAKSEPSLLPDSWIPLERAPIMVRFTETGHETKSDWFETAMLERLQPITRSRLRICASCDRLYYASRKDSRACSRRCNVKRLVRKHRQIKKEIAHANLQA
jgi:hypothetical protein